MRERESQQPRFAAGRSVIKALLLLLQSESPPGLAPPAAGAGNERGEEKLRFLHNLYHLLSCVLRKINMQLFSCECLCM